jgi:ribosomal-protein-alanine N-acetyltransferase
MVLMTAQRIEVEPLIGPRVLLRPLASADFPAWREVRVRSRAWLEPWEPLIDPGLPDPAIDPEAFRSRCGAWDRQRHFDAAHGYGMFLRDGTFIGEVSLGSVQRGPFQGASIGYWVDEAHAGQGYVPEGVVLIMRHAFEDLGLHRLEAAIVPRNAPSRRVAEKLGLRDEGTALSYLQIRGRWEDHVRYAITVDEWNERSDAFVEGFLSAR